MFRTPKSRSKKKCYVFSSCKQRNKVLLVYSVRKLQQDSYGLYISRLKVYYTLEETYLETRKQETKYH